MERFTQGALRLRISQTPKDHYSKPEELLLKRSNTLSFCAACGFIFSSFYMNFKFILVLASQIFY